MFYEFYELKSEYVAYKFHSASGITVQRIFGSVRNHITPDADLGTDGSSFHNKGFHDGTALVADITKSLADFLPGEAALTGHQPVLLTEMQMAEVLPGQADSRPILSSSIFIWKVSSITLTFGLST